MYHKLVEESFNEIKKVYEVIIPFIEDDKEEVSLIKNTINRMDYDLKQKPTNYYSFYTPMFHLNDDLRPWHNVPEEIINSLERKVYDLGAAIKTQHATIEKRITDLQLDKIEDILARDKSKHTEELLDYIIKIDPYLRKRVRELVKRRKD